MSNSPKLKKTWKNCVKQQIANPLCYFKPSTLAGVIDIVKDAEAKQYKVKAVGSGHSFSDIALTRDYLIDTHALNRVLPLSSLSLKDSADKNNLFLTECGILIKELNTALDDEKKALINMGAYTGQTIIGAISTSTHGSGISLGSLSSAVEAIIFVGEKGEVYHVERTNGISTGAIKLNGVPVQFIQDDKVFLSSVVSIGCLGVVYAVVLKVCDSYLLREDREFRKWLDVRAQLQQGDILRDNRHLEVLINPYLVGGDKEDHCLTTARNIRPPDAKTSTWARRHRSLPYTIIGLLVPDFIIDGSLRFLFNNFPKWTPKLLQSSLMTLKDGCYIDKSFKVLDLGTANNVSAYSTEIAFASDKYLEAVDAIFKIVWDIANNGQQYLTCCFSLRFVKTNDHYLSMQYSANPDDFVCMIEFPILNGTIGGEEILARIEEKMYDYGGIPHWGQWNHVGVGDRTLPKLYPKFADWMNVYHRFCPKGTFQNDFTDRCRIV